MGYESDGVFPYDVVMKFPVLGLKLLCEFDSLDGCALGSVEIIGVLDEACQRHAPKKVLDIFFFRHAQPVGHEGVNKFV